MFFTLVEEPPNLVDAAVSIGPARIAGLDDLMALGAFLPYRRAGPSQPIVAARCGQ